MRTGCVAFSRCARGGITVEMLEKHYAPFIPELRERVRRALDQGEGLETVQVRTADSSPKGTVIQ